MVGTATLSRRAAADSLCNATKYMEPLTLQQREPVFQGPWPVWTVAGLILASYAVQSLLFSDRAVLAWALVPADLFRGRWTPLVTALFVHGGWVHAGMNAVGALAFGAPAARYLGLGPKGALGFFLLFPACGVLASLGYALIHLHDVQPMAGASGAVAGLLGASTRFLERRGRLSPLATRSVVASTAAWIVINVMMGTLHYAPGIGAVSIAWEAHIIGFFAGLLLIGPFAALFGQPPIEESDGSIQSED
ncbi:MAG: rhomboid family intramembrane serine protease [Caulobacteraceae bacterium]